MEIRKNAKRWFGHKHVDRAYRYNVNVKRRGRKMIGSFIDSSRYELWYLATTIMEENEDIINAWIESKQEDPLGIHTTLPKYMKAEMMSGKETKSAHGVILVLKRAQNPRRFIINTILPYFTKEDLS